MKVTIKRLWKGKTASIRDYLVRECMAKKEDMIVKMGSEKMIVPFADLNKGVESPEEFKSRFSGSYHLIDFEWKSDNILKLL